MSYEIIVSPYYNQTCKTYENILITYKQPPGPLSKYTKQINIDFLSAFKIFQEKSCVYAILDFEKPNQFLTIDRVSELLHFFSTHNYSVDSKLTKLIKPQLQYNLLFIFSYN